MSTIQKLVSVENSYTIFSEQLQQIELYSGLSYARLENESRDLIRPAPSRAEWVLRWLLGKLQPNTLAGKSARVCPRAWRTLYNAAVMLPSSTLSRHFNHFGLLGILERTLEDCLLKNKGLVPSSREADLETRNISSLSNVDLYETVESVSGSEHFQDLHKRKRAARDDISSPPKRKRHSPSTDFDLIMESMAAILMQVGRESRKPSSRAEQLKSVLRCDVSQAARILRLWMEGLLERGTHMWLRPDIQQTHWLDAVLLIWDNKSLAIGEDESHVTELFSKHCLTVVVTLYVRLNELQNGQFWSTDKEGDVAEPVLWSLVKRLEELLVRHIFLPARSSYFSMSSSNSTAVNKQDSSEATSKLSTLLDSLKEKTHHNSDSLGPDTATDARSYTLASCLPNLFETALKCSITPTPRKRIVERPWLLALFDVFTAMLGEPHLEDPTVKASVVIKLLMALNSRNVVPGDASLRCVISRYSGLLSDRSEIQWQLIGQVIKLDSSAFLPTANGQMAAVDTSGALMVDLSQALFDAITVECGQSNAMHAEVDGLSTNESLQDTIRRAILVPLLRASAKSRCLERFVRQWHGQIVKAIPRLFKSTAEDTSIPTSAPQSIWEDRSFSRSLREVLRDSSTPSQISKLLNYLCKPFEIVSLDSSKVFAVSASNDDGVIKIYASCVVLEAVVDAVDLDMADRLQEELLAVLLDALKILSKMTFVTSTSFGRLWHIAARLISLLNLPSHQLERVLGPIFDMTDIDWTTAPDVHRDIVRGGLYEFFSFASQITNVLPSQAKPKETAGRIVASLLGNLAQRFSQRLDGLYKPSEVFIPHWDGEPWNIHSDDTLFLALTTTFIQNPVVLQSSLQEHRELSSRILSTVLQAVTLQGRVSVQARPKTTLPRTGPRNTITFPFIWESLLDVIFGQHKGTGLTTLVHTAADKLIQRASQEADVGTFLALPVRSIPRNVRQTLLDYLSGNFSMLVTGGQHCTPAYLTTLMVRLLEGSNVSARLRTHPETLWQLCNDFDISVSDDYRISLPLLDRLCSAILSNARTTIQQKQSSNFIVNLWRMIQKFIKENQHPHHMLGTLVLTVAFFKIFGTSKSDDGIEATVRLLLDDRLKFQRQFAGNLNFALVAQVAKQQAASDSNLDDQQLASSRLNVLLAALATLVRLNSSVVTVDLDKVEEARRWLKSKSVIYGADKEALAACYKLGLGLHARRLHSENLQSELDGLRMLLDLGE